MNAKHNLRHSRIYSIWCDMKRRCYNKKRKNFKNYGGRGITVCNEWKNNFLSFYNWSIKNGYKDNLTIDRIDVNGNYEPSNCMWANKKAQNNNKRTNHYITYSGKTKTLKQWSEELNLNYDALRNRINCFHWDIEKALKIKIKQTTKKYRHYITYNKKTQSLAEWSRETGIEYYALKNRINRYGWSIEKALTTPINKSK